MLLSPDDMLPLVGGKLPAGMTVPDLDRIITANEDAITQVHGPYVASLTERKVGLLRVLTLARPAASITTVTEGTAPRTLAADDYDLFPNDRRTLWRLPNGTHPAGRWDFWPTVTYVPIDDLNERIRVCRALVICDLTYVGWSSQVTQSETRLRATSYAQDRADILASFAPAWLRY
jgi:hypothetical protein